MADNNLKTNFCKVMEFNRAFDMVSEEPCEYSCYEEDDSGNIKYNPLKNIRKDIFINYPSIIKLRLALIKEEIDELNDAIEQNDIIEQRDACADILYVVYGMADVLGIAIDDYFNIKLQKNLEYYINHNLTNDFVEKTNLITNNFSNNNSQKISNFNKIKIVANEMIGINMSSKTSLELVEIKSIITDNLHKSYSELESNCYGDFSSEYSGNYKFELVANNLYDLLRWTYIMTIVIGVDADADFSIVHESNMSKLCSTKEDAIETVADYKIKHIAGVSPYDTPYYYYLPNLNKWIVKNLSTGKALKNIKYKKVSFTNPRFVF
jgi:predicted HAD superfamily Cof-like phosphohydrolase